MIENFRQINILDKVFNIRRDEWPRVLTAWFIRFLYRVGFVMGWTIIVGLFISKFGIYFLPYLFVMNALFAMFGTLLYSAFLDKLRTKFLLIATAGISAALLCLAYNLAFVNEVLFFCLLIVVISVFLKQFKILFDDYVEEMFTPSQSGRTFPLIEAADTFGGIIAALLVIFVSGAVNVFNFINLWIALILLIIPALLIYGIFEKRKHFEVHKHKKSSPLGLISQFQDELRPVKDKHFILGTLALVFFQCVIFNLLEFQYLQAMYTNVSSTVFDAGSGFEHAFVHELGVLFLLFNSSSLVVQLFLGSRLINYLGIVGAMILHGVVTFLSFLGLIFSFNFYTAILARNNFTMTSVINTNAYHCSYYALNERVRRQTREFMEGVVRPVAAITGTIFLIILQKFFVASELDFYINILMMLSAAGFLYFAYAQQNKYSDLAVHDLIYAKNLKDRLNAIDILSQKGHNSSVESLIQILNKKDEPDIVKMKILEALSEFNNVKALEAVIKSIQSGDKNIFKAALDALLDSKYLAVDSKKFLILRIDLVKTLKSLFKREKDNLVRSKLIKLLAKINDATTVDFLLNILKKSNSTLKVDAILALSNFEDLALAKVIEPYLESNNLGQRAAAIVALAKFKVNNRKIAHLVNCLIHSKHENEIAYGLWVIGELKLKREKAFCLSFVESKNVDLKINASIALAKMGYFESVPVIVDLLFCAPNAIVKKVRVLLDSVDSRIMRNIEKIVQHLVAEKAECANVN